MGRIGPARRDHLPHRLPGARRVGAGGGAGVHRRAGAGDRRRRDPRTALAAGVHRRCAGPGPGAGARDRAAHRRFLRRPTGSVAPGGHGAGRPLGAPARAPGLFPAGVVRRLPQAPSLPGGLPHRRHARRAADRHPRAYRRQHRRLRRTWLLPPQLRRHGQRRPLPLAGRRRPGPVRLHQRPQERPVPGVRHAPIHLRPRVHAGRTEPAVGGGPAGVSAPERHRAVLRLLSRVPDRGVAGVRRGAGGDSTPLPGVPGGSRSVQRRCCHSRQRASPGGRAGRHVVPLREIRLAARRGPRGAGQRRPLRRLLLGPRLRPGHEHGDEPVGRRSPGRFPGADRAGERRHGPDPRQRHPGRLAGHLLGRKRRLQRGGEPPAVHPGHGRRNAGPGPRRSDLRGRVRRLAG